MPIVIPKFSGYRRMEIDTRDRQYGAIFKEKVQRPKVLGRKLPKGFVIPEQKNIPSCYACALTEHNQYMSNVNDGNVLTLSWRDLFAHTGHYDDGRDGRVVAKWLQDMGQPQAKYCPNDTTLQEDSFMNVSLPLEGIQDASMRKVGQYSFIKGTDAGYVDTEEFLDALSIEPMPIALGLISKDWNRNYSKIIKCTGPATWWHALWAFDYNENEHYFEVTNHWGDGVRKISLDYPLIEAMSLRDLPDKEIKIMYPTMRARGASRTYLILPTGKSRITDSDTLHFLMDTGQASGPVEVAQDQIDALPTLEDYPSTKLMRSMAALAPDLFLDKD